LGGGESFCKSETGMKTKKEFATTTTKKIRVSLPKPKGAGGLVPHGDREQAPTMVPGQNL